MNKLKFPLILFANFILGFLFSWILQFVYLLLTNSLKGAGNNPDGSMLIPLAFFGIYILLCILLLCLVWRIFIIKKSIFITLLFCFLLGGFVSIFVWNLNYSTPHILSWGSMVLVASSR